jgi:hypothetical protein
MRALNNGFPLAASAFRKISPPRLTRRRLSLPNSVRDVRGEPQAVKNCLSPGPLLTRRKTSVNDASNTVIVSRLRLPPFKRARLMPPLRRSRRSWLSILYYYTTTKKLPVPVAARFGPVHLREDSPGFDKTARGPYRAGLRYCGCCNTKAASFSLRPNTNLASGAFSFNLGLKVSKRPTEKFPGVAQGPTP